MTSTPPPASSKSRKLPSSSNGTDLRLTLRTLERRRNEREQIILQRLRDCETLLLHAVFPLLEESMTRGPRPNSSLSYSTTAREAFAHLLARIGSRGE